MLNEDKLKSSIFFVEATPYERQSLWERYYKSVDWKQDLVGVMRLIGYINKNKKQEIWVSFDFAELNKKRICFYYASSNFVDHNLITNYIKKEYPVMYDNNTRHAMTNADNFHVVLHEVKK